MKNQPAAHGQDTDLVRGLGAWDGALLTIGATVGTGIFLTTGDIARVVPHAGLLLAVWIVGGLLTLAGALTYAELGAMFPRAGGLYHYLKEAYGPLWGFLFGWASFLVILSGGIAAIAVGFAEYLGAFVPALSTNHVVFLMPIGWWTWTVTGGQLAAVAAILVLTAVNTLGLREGAQLQNLLTLLKVGAVVVFIGIGLLAPATATNPIAAPLPAGSLSSLFVAVGVGMVAALWTYDGWYGLTLSAGEVRDPGRNLPRGLVWGCAIVVALYALMNIVYLRALPLATMPQSPRIAETAAASLLGPLSARLLAGAILVAAFGCLAATVLYSARVYLAMARDGLFFRALAAVDSTHRTPNRSLWAQGVWAALLAVSGTYTQLYTYVTFASVLFHAATGTALFVLRRQRPDEPRPYRVWGYPVVPALFVLGSGLLVVNTLREQPVESLVGLGLVALGLPAYAYWRGRESRILTSGLRTDTE
jgi:APA family basic amino acid/polyamine antiporter